MDLRVLTQQIQQHLSDTLQRKDATARVSVKPTSLRWLRIRVVTSCFEGKPLVEREGQIDDLLLGIDFNLGQYPILVDARPGFNDTNAIALFDLADTAIICFSPTDENRLAEIWNVNGSELAERIREMVEAGILTERSRPKDPPPRVYAVAELYLYGLKMVRKGQK